MGFGRDNLLGNWGGSFFMELGGKRAGRRWTQVEIGFGVGRGPGWCGIDASGI